MLPTMHNSGVYPGIGSREPLFTEVYPGIGLPRASLYCVNPGIGFPRASLSSVIPGYRAPESLSSRQFWLKEALRTSSFCQFWLKEALRPLPTPVSLLVLYGRWPSHHPFHCWARKEPPIPFLVYVHPPTLGIYASSPPFVGSASRPPVGHAPLPGSACTPLRVYNVHF